MARIVLGSGDLYVSEYENDTIPSVEDILKTERLGYISGGASLEYKPTFVTVKDDSGYVQKTTITDEKATLKSGVLTFDGNSLKKLCSTASVTETETERTLKIGGVGNYDGKSYVVLFHHTDRIDGNIDVLIVGQNQAGMTIQFKKDKETVVDAEFTANPMDDKGTLIEYIEEIKTKQA